MQSDAATNVYNVVNVAALDAYTGEEKRLGRITKHCWLFAALMMVWFAPQTGGAAPARLRGAAGKADITPDTPAYLAGYEMNRLSAGVHDRLMARCLILESGGVRIALVSCDVIGLPRYQIEAIRAKIKNVAGERVIIAATHTHSGPDTLGQWGRDLTTSGVSPAWMTMLRDKVAALVDTTADRLQPVRLKFAVTSDVGRISKNSRVPQILDTELSAMQVVSADSSKPVCTFVNFACHPEVLDTRQITADFPHWLYDTVEGGGGGVCLYLNGAQGGMITADFDEATAPRGQNWQAAQFIGTTLGRRALEIMAHTDVTLADALIQAERRVFTVPLDNPRFKALIALGIFPRSMVQDGNVTTEVNRLTIGPAEFLTLPGEALPNIGLYLKSRMTGKPRFLLGLCGDELGYILTPEDYGLSLYRYESSVSVGPQIEPLMVQNLLALLPK